MARYERWTAIISAGLIFGALLACKKKGSEATSEASASAAAIPPPPPPQQTAVPAESPKLGDVKRYADKEKKSDEAAVRVLTDEVKVFNEADNKTPEVATLPKDALVFRLAEVEGFQLVEFPSGVGQFAQGWVEKTGLSDKPEKVARAAVANDTKVATVKTDGGVKAVTSKDGGAADAAAAAADAAADAAAKPLTDAEKLKEAEKRAAEAEKAALDEKERRREAERRTRALERQRAARADGGK
jgi:hypothetical protein